MEHDYFGDPVTWKFERMRDEPFMALDDVTMLEYQHRVKHQIVGLNAEVLGSDREGTYKQLERPKLLSALEAELERIEKRLQEITKAFDPQP